MVHQYIYLGLTEMNKEYPRILPTGERALTVEFGNEIDEHINARLMGFVKHLSSKKIKGIEEMVPSFRAVMIHYNPVNLSYSQMVDLINETLKEDFSEVSGKKTVVRIPVCYGGEYGPDLDFVAEHAGMSKEEVIKIHSSKPYLIYMLGFMPGFPYLGGLDERIHTPRLSSPRLKLEAGSVGIAAGQTGLYPMESPGGWQIIGLTPVKCYNPDKAKAIPYEAGDYIQFYPITKEEYVAIKEMDERGDFEFERVEINE